ncbi:MAG: CorA family divalent cation transporter [Bacteroidota bacterium]
MGKKKTAGIEAKAPSENHVILELIQYSDKEYAMQADLPVEELLAQFKMNEGQLDQRRRLHDKSIVLKLGEHFCLHSLLIEDILSDHTPKAEEFDDHLFFTMKMLYSIKDAKIDYEQISFVLGKDFLLSFQEKEGDLFGSFRERIKQSSGRVRTRKADYLLYRLIDIIVDNYYTVLDEVGLQIERVEDDIYESPTDKEFQKIQKIKKELIYLRKGVVPLRDALSKLTKDESGFIEQANLRYFADVYDHVGPPDRLTGYV